MSRRVRGLLFVAGLVTIGAESSRGQSVAELQRRFDVAVARRDNARAALTIAQTERARHVYSDTIRIAGGAVMVASNADALDVARAAATSADRLLTSRFGGHTSTIPATMIAVRLDTAGKRAMLAVSKQENGREVGAQWLEIDAPSLAILIETYVQQRVAVSRPAFNRWLVTPLPVASVSDQTWRTARLEVGSSPTVVARRCYDGELESCKAYLGLTSVSDPATAWYDAAARRRLVASAGESGKLDRIPLQHCTTGNDSACIDLLRDSPALAPFLDPPASTSLRESLVLEALDEGGTGALARLLDHDDAPLQMFAVAAGHPGDSVVAAWQRHVHDGGARSTAFSPGIAMFSAGWVLMFGVAATRSSRWR